MKHLKKQIIAAYLFSIPLFLALDALWIGVIAQPFYQQEIGHLFAATPNWSIVAIFYPIFLTGLSLFAVAPALKLQSRRYATSFGALFGFFTYLTYDFTNWATLAGWTAQVSYTDIAWGTLASGFVATASYLFVQKLFPTKS